MVAPGANVVELGINESPVMIMGFADTDTGIVVYTFDPSVA